MEQYKSKSYNNLSSLADVHNSVTQPINIKTSRTNIIHKNEINDNNKNDDLNYSVYIEKKLSLSKSPDDVFTNYFPKRNEKWVDSNIIHRCQYCDINFGFFTRKHHCRSCGGVFCGNCCNKFVIVPSEIIKKPIQDTNIKTTVTNSLRWLYGEKKDLVCNTCDKKINDLIKINYLIKIFEYLDLKNLYTVKLVCKDYNVASSHILSKFRDIQYNGHLAKYTSWEKNIIWTSAEYLLNHSVWFTILIKTTIFHTIQTGDTHRIKIIESYLRDMSDDKLIHKKQSCVMLLCSRKCMKTLDSDDIIEIFDYIKYLVKEYDNLFEFDEIKEIIVHLIKIILKFKKLYIIFPIISNLMNYFFDYEDIYLDNKFINKIFKLFFNKDTQIENIIMLIVFENNFVDDLNCTEYNIENDNFLKLMINHIAKNYGVNLINNIIKMKKTMAHLLCDNFIDRELPILYPFDTNYKITKIISKETINSNTKPVLIEAEIVNKESNKKIIKFLIKKDKDLRKEQLIACLIDLLLYKLNDLNLQMIPSYRIIMLNDDVGVVEYVENSYTLRSINNKGYTLQNYILNLNVNTTLDTIKTRFVHSLSISSALAYIIGLGDRHLDNIMINSAGQIFHIDYGYVMNNPIKLFNIPEIKLTSDIIDFLGGNNSLYYQEFKKLIVKIYNLYRANKNILYIYFKFICDAGYMDWSQISSKLDTKLMIGMKCKDVEITLINEIDSGNSITDMFTDICHNYKYKLFK